jgi:WD40 repeat protein
MPIYDKTLIDPSDRDLEKALREGVKAADYRCRKNRVGWPPKGHGGFRRQLAAAEGWRHWSGGEEGPSSRLVVVWWTDFAGRRHYRVAGGRATLGDGRLGDMVFERATWPPLALLDGRTFLRRRGKRERLFALCPCGAFGEPKELGWMGGMCGPCHDRAESGDAPAAGARSWAHEGAASFIRCLAFSPDGKTLASAWDDEVRLWDVDSGEVRATARIEGSFVSSLAYSPDGTTLAAAATKVYFLSPRSAGLRKGVPIKGGDSFSNVWDLTYLPDGTRLYGRQGSRPFLLDPNRGKCVHLGGGGSDETGYSCCLRPDGTEVVLSNHSWRLRFWGLPDGRLRPAPPWFEEQQRSGQQVTDPTWSPDGRLFAAIVKPDEETYRLRLWDVAAGRARCDWPSTWAGNGWHTTFAPDGRTLVASKGETLTAYDVGGEELASLVRISPGISALAFSPDGKLLATGGHDNAIRLWPVELLRAP